MRRGGQIPAALRPASIVAAGAFAVHQLSYLAGYGGDASQALEENGHAYLSGVLPMLCVLAGVALFAVVEGGVAGVPATVRQRSPFGRAFIYPAAILAVFAVQEIAEGLLVVNHAEGVAAALPQVGPVAIPLALVFGALVWVTVRGLEAVQDCIARRFEPATHDATRSGLRSRWLAVVMSPAALPGGAAPRAPPSV